MEKSKKNLYVFLSAFFCFVIPLIVLLINFNFFKKETTATARITCLGIFVIFVLLIKFNSWLNNVIKTIGNINMQKVLSTVKGVVFILTAILILQALKNSVNDLQVIIGVIGCSFLIGNWFLLDLKSVAKLEEREKQKNDTTEAVYEAMKKIQEEKK